MATVVEDKEFSFIEHGRTWRVEMGGLAIAAGADYKIGLVTPNKQIIVTSRAYGSTGSKLVVSLHAVSFTGGAVARTLNRRLEVTSGNPLSVMEGVTATLGTVITQATILAGASTGNAQASFVGETTAIILKPSTSYVVSLLNGGSAAADIGFAFDYRTDEFLPTFNDLP